MANRLTLVNGRKSENDTLVLLQCDNEPLNFSELLTILKYYFESEEDYYPRSKNLLGSKMLFMAIEDVYEGLSVPEVCRKYNLDVKLNVQDKRVRLKPIIGNPLMFADFL